MAIPLEQYWTSPNGNRATTRYIVFHHAAFVYAIGDAVRSIYTYHRSKWPKYGAAGYHVICQQDVDGIHAYQMNPHGMQGAGVANRNHECYHICMATNFTAQPSADWLDAGAYALAEAKRRYPNAIIVGHKEIATAGNETACPGPLWSIWKPQLLARVDRLLATPPQAEPDWEALWGPIASPDQTSWSWELPRVWKLHHKRLKQCISTMHGDDAHGLIVQCFEGGDIRGRITNGKTTYEVCFR